MTNAGCEDTSAETVQNISSKGGDKDGAYMDGAVLLAKVEDDSLREEEIAFLNLLPLPSGLLNR